ncbi:MAG TPA: hypothetical protein PLU87_18835 [Sedimentisphaerales bacterium]|nr:hypothetical protein [Sedimentisphaerales bacterium]HRS13131.1 hypothetical protein [Sedimentisphaerales bacterium]
MVHEIPGDAHSDLALLMRQHPDLTKLIEAWPTLRPAIKEYILLIAEGPRDVAD